MKEAAFVRSWLFAVAAERLAYQYLRNKDLPDLIWSNTVHHTENGVMTMDDWLDTYERHIPEHIEQMQANYDDGVRRQEVG